MLLRNFFGRLAVYLTIILIANFSIPTLANAQNSPQKKDERAEEGLERQRIKLERQQLVKNLEAQRQACYQKLAVTPCLNEARDQHNEKIRDLKRQEVALNDVQRKRAAADRVKALEQRNSPEAQLKRAQDRGKAMATATQREESRALKQASREAKLAEAEKAPKTVQEPKPEGGAPAPQGKPRKPSAEKLAPSQRPGQAERMEKNRQQAAAREKQLAERRAKAAEREAKRKKPVAAGLPMPTDAK
jgi:colicin import membrane protein